MPNLRIIADNAADRATLTASSTAGALVVSNLQTDKKSDVWRAGGTTARLTLAWAVAEAIAGIALPFCNLSPTDTMRVRVTNEPSVTNLFTYSEQFDNAAWTKARCVVTADNTVAPDGTTSAELLQGDGTGTSYAYQQKTLTAGASYPVSCFVKAGTFTGTFQIHDFTDGGTVQVNLATLAVTALGNFSSPKLLALPNGWYRLSAVIVPTTTGAHNIGLFNVTTTGNVYVWGAMLQSGAGTLTSYYPSGSAAGVRPLGYIDSWQSYDYDSGNVLACPAPAVKLRGWTAAQAASAYAYGGGACARHWMPTPVQAVGLAIDISAPNNLQGYIEAARLVAGPYWSPTRNASSASDTNVDGTTHYRTDAGDLMSRASTIHKRVPIELEYMPAADRATLADILRGSRAYPIFLSVFPGHSDLALERDYTVYGKRMSDSEVAVQAAIRYGTKIEVESI